ncbi:ABC transporter ATP-binding protein [Streptomonospora wellingtoniae]|uniref:ABC transporter ATP-binding protein n=1 Tax=Streptomonospora wellingtoniae TaxID=3075544 RepID=A0ABU2L199_9ACTN|nr:ABC transporter ATP-binding protein [Streptomonospora sp. DSM 45055]MDT0305033.1 ABC transporter ATP-binding protein [Streptomonospora sp. DSM 45055]
MSEQAQQSGQAEAEQNRPPTVIVDNLHIVYRLRGSAAGGKGKGGGKGKAELRAQAAAARQEQQQERRRSGRGRASRALRRLTGRTDASEKKGGRTVHAIKGVSFTAYRGEAIGVIGSNGSGKSTILRAIAGLMPAEAGRVYTEGQPSLLGVNAALMNDLSGERNVILGCLAMGMTPQEAYEKREDIIKFSGINEKGDFSSLPMRAYSSGMAARLRFAIASAKNHDVLMIDEALATGDRKFRRRSEARIRELRGEAGTVFLVSHSNKSIRDTCDRVLWLESGSLVMDGPTDEVLEAYEEFMNG